GVGEPYGHRAGEGGRYAFDADAPLGWPYRPTPFFVQVTFGFAGNEDVSGGLDVVHRYQGDIFGGEKRSELLVVPAASVRVAPEIAIIPSSSLVVTPTGGGRSQASREIRVTVVNDRKGAAEGALHLELPQGWSAQPVQQALKFSREDESQTVRFDVRPPATVATGEYHVKAILSENGADFTRGYQV